MWFEFGFDEDVLAGLASLRAFGPEKHREGEKIFREASVRGLESTLFDRGDTIPPALLRSHPLNHGILRVSCWDLEPFAGSEGFPHHWRLGFWLFASSPIETVQSGR